MMLNKKASMPILFLLIFISVSYKCNAELYYVTLHENKKLGNTCSTVPFLAHTTDVLCKSKDIDIKSKFVLLTKVRNRFVCSINPHLSFTKKELCTPISPGASTGSKSPDKTPEKQTTEDTTSLGSSGESSATESTSSGEVSEPLLSPKKTEANQKNREEERRELLNKIIENKLNSAVLESIQDKKERFLGNEVGSESELPADYLGNHCQQQCNSIQLEIIPSGSDYYDEMLKGYATYIENIKPFNKKKISEYINFINRMIHPNSVNVMFHNCSDKSLSKQCATLSLNKRKLSANVELNSYKEAFTSQDSETESLGANHFSIKYKGFKNSSLDYELRSNNQHKIKYSRLFEVSPTKFINTSISYDNFDYLADIYGLDNFNNLVNDELTNENGEYRNYSSSNLVLDVNYTTLKNQSVEYTIGYAHRYTKYRHNFGLEKNHSYNINNIYAISRLHELGVSFYLGNEFSFNGKYRNTVAAVFYKKHFKDYFFNVLFMHGDRKMNAEYKAKYYNSELKIGKKIEMSGKTLRYINPYFSLRYIDILGFDKKNNAKINKNTKNKLQKVVGVVVMPANKGYGEAALNLSYWRIDKKKKGVSLSLNVNF